jgi:hypothetical protein
MHETDGFDDRGVHAFIVASAGVRVEGGRGRGLWMTPQFLASRGDGAGDKRNHDEERPKGGDLGDVAQRVSSDGMHLGLLDLGKFTLCSLIVHVNSTEEAHRPKRAAWLT